MLRALNCVDVIGGIRCGVFLLKSITSLDFSYMNIHYPPRSAGWRFWAETPSVFQGLNGVRARLIKVPSKCPWVSWHFTLCRLHRGFSPKTCAVVLRLHTTVLHNEPMTDISVLQRVIRELQELCYEVCRWERPPSALTATDQQVKKICKPITAHQRLYLIKLHKPYSILWFWHAVQTFWIIQPQSQNNDDERFIFFKI